MGAKAEKDRWEAGSIKLDKADYIRLVESVKKGLREHPELLRKEAPGLKGDY